VLFCKPEELEIEIRSTVIILCFKGFSIEHYPNWNLRLWKILWRV